MKAFHAPGSDFTQEPRASVFTALPAASMGKFTLELRIILDNR